MTNNFQSKGVPTSNNYPYTSKMAMKNTPSATTST